jgi:hypothetical protein
VFRVDDEVLRDLEMNLNIRTETDHAAIATWLGFRQVEALNDYAMQCGHSGVESMPLGELRTFVAQIRHVVESINSWSVERFLGSPPKPSLSQPELETYVAAFARFDIADHQLDKSESAVAASIMRRVVSYLAGTITYSVEGPNWIEDDSAGLLKIWMNNDVLERLNRFH